SYFFASNLVLFWIATISGWVWTGFLFYVWVSIFTALMPSLFWLLANYVFYANEGRRLFPVVLAGGLSGSILGGASTSLLAPAIGTPGLMLPAAALLVLVALLTRVIDLRERERMSERSTDLRSRERSRAVSVIESPWRLLLRSRYLTMLAGLVLITSLTSTLVDYQFNAVVEKSFLDRDSLTRFLGGFFAFVSFLAFVLQILLAGRLLGRLGVSAGLLSLPLAIAASTFSFILYPSLATAVFLKTADDGINNSAHRASVEVLYLPITLSLKNRLKTWIDMFVERVSRGLGGLVILGSTSLLGLGAHHLGYAVLALTVPWILLVLSLRREYVNTLRESIAKRDITDFDSALRDPATRAVFHQVLTGTDVREIAYALELAQGIRDPAILDEVEALASHQSPIVRAAALRALQADSNANRLADLESRVEDEDPEAGAEALALWLRTEPSKAQEAFERQVAEGNVERISAVLG
ncbi:MAG: Npt1/Npt2 family nucleotide transporter, partial [Vicinamibacteria bacterium]